MDPNNETIVEAQVHRSNFSEEHDESRSEAPVDSPVETGKQVDSTLYAVVNTLNEGMNNNNSLLKKLISYNSITTVGR